MTYTDNQLKTWKKEIYAPTLIATRVKLQKDSGEFVGICPFHEEKSPSFHVHFKDNVWMYKCFGCSVSGNIFQFFQKVDKLSFNAAVEKVLKLSEWEEGKAAVEKTFGNVLDEKKEIVTYPISKMTPLERVLEDAEEAQKWLKDRGIETWAAKDMHCGFIQSVRTINPNHPWVDNGWMVFATVEGDTITCLKYRSVLGKKTPEGKSAILRAPKMKTSLYGLNSLVSMDDAFLVEGEPDALVMHQAGYCAAALPSAEYTLTPAERDKLVKSNRIFLAGDMDLPGRTAMGKLWTEFQDRTYLIEWPDGCKDANDALKQCDYDTELFGILVENLKAKALERPIADYYDMKESVRNADDTAPMDNPRRLHFSNKDVDEMAVVLPGNVVSVFATYTGSGKTTWCLDGFELEEAMKHGSTVLNYSAELSPQEFAMLVAANLLEKNRLTLVEEDFQKAASILDDANAKFYVGYNPDLNRIGLVLDSLEWAIRRLGANIVVLDHLHFLCRGESNAIKAQEDAMQRIKNLAVKYQVIFVVVGQSRKEQPTKKSRPSEISDAKGSESFTSDASTVYHIHRNIRRDINWDAPETWPRDILDNITDIRMPKCRTKGPGKAVARQFFRGEIGKFLPYVQER